MGDEYKLTREDGQPLPSIREMIETFSEETGLVLFASGDDWAQFVHPTSDPQVAKAWGGDVRLEARSNAIWVTFNLGRDRKTLLAKLVDIARRLGVRLTISEP